MGGRPEWLTSIGPRVSRDIESNTVIPDPEFYNVGRSVSGFFNFGGVSSIRFFSVRRPTTALATVQKTCVGDRKGLTSTSTISTLALSAQHSDAIAQATKVTKDSEPETAEPAQRLWRFRSKRVLAAFVLVALGLAAIVGLSFGMTMGNNASEAVPNTAGQTRTIAPSLAPTRAPSVYVGPIWQPKAPTMAPTMAPTTSPTSKPTAAPTVLEKFFMQEWKLDDEAPSEECASYVLFVCVRWKSVVPIKATLRNKYLSDTVRLTGMSGTLYHKGTDVGRVKRDSDGGVEIGPGERDNIILKLETHETDDRDFWEDKLRPAIEDCSSGRAAEFEAELTMKFDGAPATTFRTSLPCSTESRS